MAGRRRKPADGVLGAGKLPAELLAKVLAGFRASSPDVLLGPGLGLDSAVVKVTGKYLAVTSDPITLAEDLLSYYCIHVNANDLAVTGAEPQFMTAVCLLPLGAACESITRISSDLARYARKTGIIIVGGHTEITPTVNVPIMVGTMLGRLRSSRPVSSAGAKTGHLVVMTKQAGLEATAIIARERPKRLARAGFSDAAIRRAQRLLFRPGISILPEARLAADLGCSAMHDATEGGIVTALWELATASRVRINVDLSKIPLLDLTVRACRLWRIDPLRAISSGSLLFTLRRQKLQPLLAALRKSKIPAAVIGEVVSGRPGTQDVSTGQSLKPCRDEIVKLFR